MKRLKSLSALRCVSLMLLMCFALTAQDVLAKKDKDGKAPASIVFAEKKHDFGNIREDGGPASYEFVFTNEGETPLVIISATASCGCTMPHYPKAPISPGKSVSAGGRKRRSAEFLRLAGESGRKAKILTSRR